MPLSSKRIDFKVRISKSHGRPDKLWMSVHDEKGITAGYIFTDKRLIHRISDLHDEPMTPHNTPHFYSNSVREAIGKAKLALKGYKISIEIDP